MLQNDSGGYKFKSTAARPHLVLSSSFIKFYQVVFGSMEALHWFLKCRDCFLFSYVFPIVRITSSWFAGAMWLVIFRYAEELNIQIDQHAEAWATLRWWLVDPHLRICCESYAHGSGSSLKPKRKRGDTRTQMFDLFGTCCRYIGRIGDYELRWTKVGVDHLASSPSRINSAAIPNSLKASAFLP